MDSGAAQDEQQRKLNNLYQILSVKEDAVHQDVDYPMLFQKEPRFHTEAYYQTAQALPGLRNGQHDGCEKYKSHGNVSILKAAKKVAYETKQQR